MNEELPSTTTKVQLRFHPWLRQKHSAPSSWPVLRQFGPRAGRLFAALFVVVMLTTTRQSFTIPPRSEDEPRGPITHEMSCNGILFRIKRGRGGNNLHKSLFGQISDYLPTEQHSAAYRKKEKKKGWKKMATSSRTVDVGLARYQA